MRYIVVVFISCLAFFSCQSKREVVQVVDRLKNISDLKLIKSVADNEVLYHDLFFKKLDIEVNLDDKSYNFKGNLYLVRDSQIVVSVIPLMGIELYRMAFYPDSICFIDRVKKKAVKSDYDYFKSQFLIDIDYYTLESLLANRMFCYPSDDDNNDCIRKFKGYVKDNHYSLQSLKTRKVNRYERKDLDDVYFQEFLIEAINFRIFNISIQNFRNTDKIEIGYSNFKEYNGIVFPSYLKMNGYSAGKKLEIKMEVNSLYRDSDQKILFNVPEKYQIINYH